MIISLQETLRTISKIIFLPFNLCTTSRVRRPTHTAAKSWKQAGRIVNAFALERACQSYMTLATFHFLRVILKENTIACRVLSISIWYESVVSLGNLLYCVYFSFKNILGSSMSCTYRLTDCPYEKKKVEVFLNAFLSDSKNEPLRRRVQVQSRVRRATDIVAIG